MDLNNPPYGPIIQLLLDEIKYDGENEWSHRIGHLPYKFYNHSERLEMLILLDCKCVPIVSGR